MEKRPRDSDNNDVDEVEEEIFKKTNKAQMSILECLTNLTSWERNVRMQASLTLIEQLQKEEYEEDLLLCVERLTHGLASGRQGSRQGFGMVLCELLRLFPNALSVSKVFQIMDDKMDASGEKGEAEKQMYIGKIFVVCCVIRSGRFASMEEEERKRLLKKSFETLVAMGEKKSYLLELSCHTLIELIHQVRDENEFMETGKSALNALLSQSMEDLSPEALSLLLVLQKSFNINASVFNPEWSNSVSNVFIENEGINSALLLSSYVHPRIHYVWKLMMGEAKEQKKERELLNRIDTLLIASYVDNRKFLGLSLFCEFVKEAKNVKELEYYLLLPNVTRVLINNLTHPTKMSPICTLIMNQLNEWIKNNQNDTHVLQFIVKDSLSVYNPVHLSLTLTSNLSKENGMKMLSQLAVSESLLTKDKIEFIASLLKKNWKKWARENESENETVKEISLKISKVFLSMFFGKSGEDKDWIKSRLLTIFNEFESSGHLFLFELLKGYKQVKHLATSMKGMDKNSAYFKIAELIMFRMIIEDNEEAKEDLVLMFEDIEKSYQKFQSKKDTEKSILVLLSSMIELLTLSSLLNRNIIVNTFRSICSILPKSGVLDIVEAVLANDEEFLDEEEKNALAGINKEKQGGEGEGEEQEEQEEEQEEEENENDVVFPSEIFLNEIDPDYLKQMDHSLVQMFKVLRSKSKGKSVESKSKENKSIMDFKLRVLDLLEMFVRNIPKIENDSENRMIVFSMIPNVLSKIKANQFNGKMDQFRAKLEKTLLILCDLKEFPSFNDYEAEFVKTLNNITQFVCKGNPSPSLIALVQKCVSMMVKIMVKQEFSNVDKAREVLAKVLNVIGTKKNLKHLSFDSFFAPLFRKTPEFGLSLFSVISTQSQSKEWLQRARLQVMKAMNDLLNQSAKTLIIKEFDLLKNAVQCVERVFLTFLRFEISLNSTKTLKSQKFKEYFSHYKKCVNLLNDKRIFSNKKDKESIALCFPLRYEVKDTLNELTRKWNNLNTTEVQKTFAMLMIEQK